MQLLTVILLNWNNSKKRVKLAEKKINQYARYGTVFLATVQGYGVAWYRKYVDQSRCASVIDPGMFLDSLQL